MAQFLVIDFFSVKVVIRLWMYAVGIYYCQRHSPLWYHHLLLRIISKHTSYISIIYSWEWNCVCDACEWKFTRRLLLIISHTHTQNIFSDFWVVINFIIGILLSSSHDKVLKMFFFRAMKIFWWNYVNKFNVTKIDFTSSPQNSRICSYQWQEYYYYHHHHHIIVGVDVIFYNTFFEEGENHKSNFYFVLHLEISEINPIFILMLTSQQFFELIQNVPCQRNGKKSNLKFK